MTKFSGLLLLCLCLLALPMAVSAFDLTINNEVISYSGTDIYGYDGYNYVSDVTFEEILIPTGEIGVWGHSLDPSFMMVPQDHTVQRALLQITGWAPNGVGNGIVEVQQEYRWTGPTGWECLTSYSDKVFELTDIDSDLWNTSPLFVQIAQPSAVGVTLTSSTLLVEYGPGAEVPEPATLILFGAGLVGGGIFLRRRKSK